MLPLSTPAIATVSFFGAIARWNDWFTAMLYVRSDSLMPLQYLLQRIMMQIQVLTDSLNKSNISVMLGDINIPSETIRMAMLILAIGPMLFVFVFFQKYFVQGLTVGSVKG